MVCSMVHCSVVVARITRFTHQPSARRKRRRCVMVAMDGWIMAVDGWISWLWMDGSYGLGSYGSFSRPRALPSRRFTGIRPLTRCLS